MVLPPPKRRHATTERRMAVALEQIGGAIQQLAGSLAATELKLETEAVELALTIARKLSTELILREPFTEIAALATECLKQLTAAPHVVVRVNDALHETARERLEEIAQSRGFEGRLVVVAEPEIAVGDCRIEWADGGVVRHRAKTDLAIGDAIGRYLGARQSAAMPELGDINR
jgi:flagellar assembly protein FliH